MFDVNQLTRVERTIFSFDAEITHACTIHIIEQYPDMVFKGNRLCVTCEHPERFEIIDIVIGCTSHFQRPISAKMFPVLPDFKDCKIPEDFERKLAELIAIDYLTCSPAQKMKMIIKNISRYDCHFHADMIGIAQC